MSGDSSNLFELPNKLGAAAMMGGSAGVGGLGGGGMGGSADGGGMSFESSSISPSAMNDVINGIHASKNSLLGNIPSRDIVTGQEKLTQDPVAQPNYIPPPAPQQQPSAAPAQPLAAQPGSGSRGDFVGDLMDRITAEAAAAAAAKKPKKRPVTQTTMDSWLDDPTFLAAVVAAVMYFLFEISLVRGLFVRGVEMICGAQGSTMFFDAVDGSPKTAGSVLKTIVFGFMYFGFMYFLMDYSSRAGGL
jgi:hypothetical protein